VKRYDIKYCMSETARPKVDALFAALRAAEDEEIELIEVQPKYDYSEFTADECREMCRVGPKVDRLDQITDRQWRLIEMLIAAHDEHLKAKATKQ
jgi:hypothetical protein